MTILAFDLSSRQGSIALTSDGSVLLEARHWPNDRRNSAPFFRALDEIIRAHGAPETIVVGLGPGSYTGTRIAISAAIGLQLTFGACLCGLASICAVSTEDDFAVIGDAKRSSFFCARIIRSRLTGDVDLLSEQEMAQRISETPVPIYTSDQLPQFNRAELSFPRAELLCQLAHGDENLARAPLQPIYLRQPHITSPRVAST